MGVPTAIVLREGIDVRYAWILANREVYSIPMMCELLGVSRSGLSAAAKRERSDRTLEEAEVVEQIRRAQTKHKGRYGRRRMTPEVSEALAIAQVIASRTASAP